MKSPSGKFVLRIPEKFHAFLQKEAIAKNISLNQHCNDRLLGGLGISQPDFAAVLMNALFEALRIHGQDLEGIVLFGSWARGEQSEGSDIDLLIVLTQGMKIKRELYRKWEKAESHFSSESLGSALEPSLVALPNPDQAFSGLWAEISIDGMILFDRSQKVRQTLCRVREAIADGTLRREKAHGQNYWIHEKKAA